MKIQVKSEIGALKRVLLHRPGGELEQLMPEYLDQLLFDDIPYLKAAQKEHDYFADILRWHGAQVVYLEDLMAETLAAQPALKQQFIADFLRESGNLALHFQQEIMAIFDAIEDEKALVEKTMTGLTMLELPRESRGPLVKMLAHTTQFVLAPIPNLYFTRDPFACVGQGVSLNRMFSRTRNRETIYGRYILNHHPDYAGQVPLYYQHNAPFSIEGGDLLNLSPRVLAVGLSQRTSAEAVELLARNIFADAEAEIETILALDIPNLRAYMHLDTVFTQVDVDKFTIHPAIMEMLSVYRLCKRGSEGDFTVELLDQPLAQILRESLGLAECALIHCGGKDQVASAREQWNDGANTLAIAPGVAVVYDRNRITNRALAEIGVTVLEVPSSELSRGRGGPRCMSMPLWREPVE